MGVKVVDVKLDSKVKTRSHKKIYLQGRRVALFVLDIQTMPTAYISHPLCLKHDMGGYHPESPARIFAIENQLIAAGLVDHPARLR